MITWTDAAKEVLENYCRRTRENLRDSGADPDEVIEDLRRHVDEEILAAKISLVTEDDIRRILSRVGEPIKSAGEKNHPDIPFRRKKAASLTNAPEDFSSHARSSSA